MPNDVTFPLHFIVHVFARIREQTSQEEQLYRTTIYLTIIPGARMGSESIAHEGSKIQLVGQKF